MIKNGGKQLDKPGCANKIEKIKNEKIKQYLTKTFNCQVIIVKLIYLITIIAVSCIPFFILRQHAIDNYENMNVVFNRGGTRGIGENNPVGIDYFVRAIIMVILTNIIILSKNPMIFVGVSLCGINTLLNVIDKTMVDKVILSNGDELIGEHTVVDYMPIKGLKSIYNSADFGIIIGSVEVAIGVVYCVIKKIIQKQKAKKATTNLEQKAAIN